MEKSSCGILSGDTEGHGHSRTDFPLLCVPVGGGGREVKRWVTFLGALYFRLSLAGDMDLPTDPMLTLLGASLPMVSTCDLRGTAVRLWTSLIMGRARCGSRWGG